MATLVSRLTGFLSKVALAATLGLGLVNSSYTVANTLPNIVYELLLGGVLTSIVVPVLVRAAREDRDGGEIFTQQLLTVSAVVLALATVVAVAAAPLLVRIYLSPGNKTDPHLATTFGYLLLPEIFFYGVGALFGAVLNARGVFGPPAWAPVVNNVVVLAALGGYWFLPHGSGATDTAGVGTAQLLVLGLGTTLGIVVQAVVMVPAMRRLDLRWRWGWDRRLSEFGGLAAWVVGYVLVSQLGYVVVNRVASAADRSGIAIYSYAWNLFQVPYGVLGVSLLTVLMPRMSAAAAAGRVDQVVADLSLGSRLSAVALLPVTALMTAFGGTIGVALFSLGHSDLSDSTRLGAAVAVSAFGLLPYAVVLLQLRVFYALTDARTPTLIMVIMTVLKVPLCYACALVLPDDQVVLGLSFVNSLTFVVGAVIGELWLRARLGRLGSARMLRTVVLTALASVLAALVAVIAATLLRQLLGSAVGVVGQAWLTLLVGVAVGGAVLLAAMRLLQVEELTPVLARVGGLLRRRS